AIPEKVIRKVTEPFFIDEDIMNHSSGIGLGLTICQAILRSHGSKLAVQNTDSGVRISFVIPKD
ncbi:MAG: hybrid sensor histidine kinase/response regulator, partial [Bdellovibrionaceae bacterium]|nr:hybrid sensor histidine kinase/response regulator [Pseudobdellovibrionaceae bacterium]